MKKGLRRAHRHHCIKPLPTEPRPYEEGIKTVQTERLFLPRQTEPRPYEEGIKTSRTDGWNTTSDDGAQTL